MAARIFKDRVGIVQLGTADVMLLSIHTERQLSLSQFVIQRGDRRAALLPRFKI